jgi:hypothetical protein
MPEAEMQDLITEIRSITQGIGTFESSFSHYQELVGRDAERVVQARKQSIEAGAHHYARGRTSTARLWDAPQPRSFFALLAQLTRALHILMV